MVDGEQTTPERVAEGLSRIATVLRSQSWAAAGERGLTVTQGQVLALIADAPSAPRLGEVSRALGIKAPTASNAVSALVDKGLVAKRPDASDGRAIALHLTAQGKREATRALGWPAALADAVGVLSTEEQAVMLRGLVKMIRALQREGHVPAARTCVDCRHFRPFAHAGSPTPHHCGFVDGAFADGDLQVACPDHDAADEEQAHRAYRRFLRVVS